MKDGDFSGYNDYELIYYAKENNEEALNVLIWKYSFLIRTRLESLHIPKSYQDDMYQEGCIILLKAIDSFDESKNKTFTKYFDLLLQRRLITLMRREYKTNNVEFIENVDFIMDDDSQNSLNEMELLKENEHLFTPIERQVYLEVFINDKTPLDVSKELNINVKIIYNAIQRVKKKIRNELKQ